MSKFTMGFMLLCAFFSGMAVAQDKYIVAGLCILCIVMAPHVVEE